MRRLCIGPRLAAAIVGGSFVAQATAAPGGGTGQSTFPMTCNGVPVNLTIGGGTWSAAYMSTGAKFVPKGTHLVATDLTTGTVILEVVDMKHAAGKATSTCVDTALDDGVQVSFVVVGKIR